MPALADPVTDGVITTAWGAQINDRLVQIFTSTAQLGSALAKGWIDGSYGSSWAPVPGSLALCLDTYGMYVCIGPSPDTGGLYRWKPLGARGVIGTTGWGIPGSAVLADAALPNTANAWRDIAKISPAAFVDGGLCLRQGFSYQMSYFVIGYAPTANLSLFSMKAGVRLKTHVAGQAYGEYVNIPGIWVGNSYNSTPLSGSVTFKWDHSSATIGVDFFLVGQTMTGQPGVTITKPSLTVTELGGPG